MRVNPQNHTQRGREREREWWLIWFVWFTVSTYFGYMNTLQVDCQWHWAGDMCVYICVYIYICGYLVSHQFILLLTSQPSFFSSFSFPKK